ncbi:MAG: AMP-binding protein [Eubacteriales bacterium]|nr:AMP-binding protein [Eubacteriales bacterium]
MRKDPLNSAARFRDLKEFTDRSIHLFAKNDAFYTLKGKTEYEAVTFSQFGDDLCALANALIDKGFSGRSVAVIGENSYRWVLAYFATVNINATVVPLDKELNKEEILSFVQRSKTSVLFYSPTFEDEAAFVVQNVPDIVTISLGDSKNAGIKFDALLQMGKDIVAQGKDRYSDIEIDDERTCAILFTSGTTGKSKGVMLSHHNLASNATAAAGLIQYAQDDVLLSVLPIHHSYENMCGLFGSICFGAANAFCESIKILPACLALFRPTLMVLVPLYVETFYKRIWEGAKKQGKEKKLKFGIFLGNLLAAVGIDIRDKLLHEVRAFFGGRLKTVICGGAYLNPELVKGFRSLGVMILQGYGITECSPIISANKRNRHKDTSVGWLASCCEVRVDEMGEIQVRGDNVMKGYLDDEGGTAAAFEGEWFKTGDIGHVGKDGFLYVTGRCKNLIVLKNGKNIMPDEIEYLLGKSTLIAEVMVKEAPGDANGSDSLMAIIYPDPEAAGEMDAGALRKAVQDEIDKVNQKLVYYKQIRQFILRDSEFPKTTTRKIMRYKVENRGKVIDV